VTNRAASEQTLTKVLAAFASRLRQGSQQMQNLIRLCISSFAELANASAWNPQTWGTIGRYESMGREGDTGMKERYICIYF